MPHYLVQVTDFISPGNTWAGLPELFFLSRGCITLTAYNYRVWLMSISRSFSSLLLPVTEHPLLKQQLVICSQMPCDTSVFDWFSRHLGCGLPVLSVCALLILPKFVLLVNFLGLLLTSGANVTDEIWVISAGSPIQTDFALLGPSVLRPLKPVLYVYVISSFITNFPHTSFLYHVYDWRYSLCDRKTIYTELVCGEIIFGEIVLLSIPFFSMASSSF